MFIGPYGSRPGDMLINYYDGRKDQEEITMTNTMNEMYTSMIRELNPDFTCTPSTDFGSEAVDGNFQVTTVDLFNQGVRSEIDGDEVVYTWNGVEQARINLTTIFARPEKKVDAAELTASMQSFMGHMNSVDYQQLAREATAHAVWKNDRFSAGMMTAEYKGYWFCLIDDTVDICEINADGFVGKDLASVKL